MYSFVVHYQKLASQIGQDAVTVGSDLNAPISHFGPQCDSSYNIGKEGFWKASQYGNLWQGFPIFQRENPNLSLVTKKFLALWAQVQSSR
jgi:hypothetical protein